MEKILAEESHVLITVGTLTLNSGLVLIKEQHIGRLGGREREREREGGGGRERISVTPTCVAS